MSEQVTTNSVSATLQERGKRYGDFSEHARICQSLLFVMQNAETSFRSSDPKETFPSWEYLSHVQRQALTVIADKIARILSGDFNYAGNWHDIQGYARLVEERLAPDLKQRMEGIVEEVTKATQTQVASMVKESLEPSAPLQHDIKTQERMQLGALLSPAEVAFIHQLRDETSAGRKLVYHFQ